MNVGIVTDWMDSGAGVVSRQYAEAIVREHNVYIFARPKSLAHKHDPFWNQPNVTWSSRHTVPQGLWKWEFERWLKANHIEVVIFNEQRRWDAVCWARQAGVKVGAYIDYYLQKSVPLFALYDFLICNTKRHHSVFDWHPQAFYIPWGTNTGVFAPSPDVSTSREVRFFISAGFEGRPAPWGEVVNRRGVEYAMRAFRDVKGEARLIVHSQLSLDSCALAWQELVHSNPKIEWIHKTVRAPGLYHLGDVYVYPSKLDGIGLTLPEALSCGLAALATDESPMKEFVRDGENGRLIPVRAHKGRSDGYYWAEALCDVEVLTELMQAYVNNPNLLKAHRENARAYALSKLDWTKNAAALAQHIKDAKIRDVTDKFAILSELGAAQDRELYPTVQELLLRAGGRLWRYIKGDALQSR
jgi:1,2-diacylglycerol 3-alpha-glucosyltransferase